jgi:hypothetical protein
VFANDLQEELMHLHSALSASYLCADSGFYGVVADIL